MALYSFAAADLATVWGKVGDLPGEHVCALPVYTLVKPVRVVNLVRTETVLDNAVTATAAPDMCPPGTTDINK